MIIVSRYNCRFDRLKYNNETSLLIRDKDKTEESIELSASCYKNYQKILVSDNGSQSTSIKFMQVCKDLNIKQIFTSYNNPKGNADT